MNVCATNGHAHLAAAPLCARVHACMHERGSCGVGQLNLNSRNARACVCVFDTKTLAQHICKRREWQSVGAEFMDFRPHAAQIYLPRANYVYNMYTYIV